VADAEHIAISLEAGPEFFAQIAASASEQKARKFERAGWGIEHEGLF